MKKFHQSAAHPVIRARLRDTKLPYKHKCIVPIFGFGWWKWWRFVHSQPTCRMIGDILRTKRLRLWTLIKNSDQNSKTKPSQGATPMQIYSGRTVKFAKKKLAFFFRDRKFYLAIVHCCMLCSPIKKYYVVKSCVAGVELKEGDSELNSRQAKSHSLHIYKIKQKVVI